VVLLGEAVSNVHVGREPVFPAHAARRDAEALEEHGTELGGELMLNSMPASA